VIGLASAGECADCDGPQQQVIAVKLFECQSCGSPLHFENSRCESCGHILGYLPHHATLSALEPLGGDRWRALAASGGGNPIAFAPIPPLMPVTG
jgi:hypothetical protein